jgi:hypothetical protein
MGWDVFISHASEDKDAVARPLAELLREVGLKVWLDENELVLGDSLSRKIDEGLAHSAYGVVILSQNFFQKGWPRQELAGLTARQVDGRKVILPVWHGVDKADILSFSPTLADALAVSTQKGLDNVRDAVLRAVSATPETRPTSGPPRRNALTRRWIIPSIGVFALLIGFSSVLYWSGLHKQPADAAEKDVARPLFWRLNHGRISGYFSVSCNSCSRPRAWAFYLSPSKDGMPLDPPEILRSMTRGPTWPAKEFLYPEDKPGVGYCVDFPLGACTNYPSTWQPQHGDPVLPKKGGPSLRLNLRDVSSGFELHISNDGETLAQGINVDVMAWQAGAPGAEFVKSYAVRDLSPLADFTIQSVFGPYPGLTKE